ncbi:MAG: hypothetical protein PUB10_02135 [Clostridiales bacterium]|nr:hypothetical protein [Clostridiales bacterium]
MPKWLKAVFVRYIFVTIGEEELCLTEEEQGNYLEKWQLTPTEAAYSRIQELGHGNPLYLRIVAMRLSDGGFLQNIHRITSKNCIIVLRTVTR